MPTWEKLWYAGAAALLSRFDDAQRGLLDPGLVEIAAETGADMRLLGQGRKLNEMAPAILNGMAERKVAGTPA